MKIFIIDNNVDGLLCALYTSFTEKIIPDFVVDKKYSFKELKDSYKTYNQMIDFLKRTIPEENEPSK